MCTIGYVLLGNLMHQTKSDRPDPSLAWQVQLGSGMNTTTAILAGTKKQTFWTIAREQLEAKRAAIVLASVAMNDVTIPVVESKSAKQPKTIEVRNMRGNEWHANVTPRVSIRLHGVEKNTRTPYAFDLTFKVGDVAVYSGYNLTYTGKIVSIGEKTVRIEDCGRVKALRFDDFAFWNRDFDAERIAQENADTMMRI
jgi:hypothetical protein